MQTTDDTPKKTSMLRLWEYAVSAAVKAEELAEHEGNQVLQCWNEAEQLQDTNDAKAAKFRKSLSMKFGPAKGGTVFEIMQKRKELTIQLIQQKQQIKQQQLQQQQFQHSSQEGSPSFGSQEQAPPQPQQPQQQQQQLMQSGSQPIIQQQLNITHGGQKFTPMQNPGLLQQPQQQTQQHGVFNTFNTLPAGMGMNGYNNPHQLNNGQILTPISGQMVQMPVGYPGSHLGGPRPGNPTPPPGGPQLGGVNMHIPGQQLPMGSVPSQMMPGPAGNNVIFNSNTSNPAFQRPPYNPAMNNAGATTANMPKKAPAKRSANAAGMDDADKKNPKKRPVPQAKPSVPGQSPQTGNAGASNMNRPLNTPGGANFYYNPNSNNNNPGQQSQGSTNSTIAQPMTAAQEIESWTERPNSAQEGLEPVTGTSTVGGNAVTAPLVTQDFIRQESDLSKEKLRMGFPQPSVPSGPSSSAVAGTAQAMMRNLNIPGGPGSLSVHHHEAEHSWQSNNIVDKQMMGRAALKVLQGTDMKIGVPSLNMLSNGIQQHLKNVLESAFKLSKTRANKTAINSYDGISRMIIEHGHGNALPENQQNIAIHWGDDVSGALHREELEARRTLKQYEVGLEETLAQKMRAYDEERGKAGQRRRPGTSDADSWWAKEEGAEKEGLLGWSDLAMTSFKQSVARKHELGGFVVKNKARSSTGGAGNSAVPQSSSVPEAALTSDAAVKLSSGELGSPQPAQPPVTAVAGEDSVSDAWTRQPCPLNLSRSSQVVMHEDDLAHTLARSTSSRGLPSNTRSTGSCLYNWKMGVYTNQTYS